MWHNRTWLPAYHARGGEVMLKQGLAWRLRLVLLTLFIIFLKTLSIFLYHFRLIFLIIKVTSKHKAEKQK
jgi:hypothetical protein